MSIDLARCHQIISDDFRPIGTAPKDGTLIIVAHEDCGAFPMRWKAEGYNPPFSVREGLWEAWDGSFTWVDHDDLGPSHWKPAAPTKQRSAA